MARKRRDGNGDLLERRTLMKPLYEELKEFIQGKVERGEWPEGHRILSENELARRFRVSRMTANRAVNELSREGLLRRVAGVGTFVAEQVPEGALLEIRNIADEIGDRGHRHASRVVRHEAVEASAETAARFGVPKGADLFHTLLVHSENDVPIQVEDRFVNPVAAPGYLDQDFGEATPSAYLLEHCPLTAVEHVIEAVRPDFVSQRLLEIERSEPCLLVRRRTWSGPTVATYALLTYPGSRYRLSGHFAPGSRGVGAV